MARYHRTIATPLELEIDKIKGSRFIAFVSPATDEAAALDALQRVRSLHHAARHHCFAYRIGEGDKLFRYSDDGEPSGTGGQPILRAIDALELSDVMVVVVRYFGGTKLGTGGLIRAYGGAAKAALEASEVVKTLITQTLSVRHGYELSGAVKGILRAQGLTPINERFGAEVSFELALPEEEIPGAKRALIEGTGGRVEVEVEV